MRKTNYHMHTKRCMHASGSDEDYVLAAIEGGYEEIGFSERELRSAKEIACKVKTPLYKRVFEMYELSLRPPSNTQFITTIEIYYYSSEASSEKTESHYFVY